MANEETPGRCGKGWPTTMSEYSTDLMQLLAEERRRRHEAEEQLRILQEKVSAERAMNLGMDPAWRSGTTRENAFDDLIENATDVIYQVDENGYFNLFNAQAIKKFGYSRENLLGRHFSEFVAPAHRERVYHYYLRMRDEDVEKTYLEFPVVNAWGEEMWIGQNVTRVTSADGTLNFTAIARDITEQHHQEQQLKSFMTMVTTLVTTIIAALVIEDNKHRITITNPTFCHLFGIKTHPSELAGTNFLSILEGLKSQFQNPDAFWDQIQSNIARQEVKAGEEYQTTSGRTILVNFIPIVSGDENFGNLWYFEDISTRRNRELRIKRSEEKYRGIIENMEFGILEVDPDGNIIRAYERFCRLTGYREEELLGRNAIDLLLPEEYADKMHSNDQNRKSGISSVYESEIITKSGERISVLIGGAPFYDENGTFIGSIGIHSDITLQKQLQSELVKARQEAEKARDAEKEFLANMSHEIRNPINTILGVTHLLLETPVNKEQLELLSSLRSSSEILHALVNDILDFSKITEGKYELNKKNFDLYEHILSVVNSFRHPIQAKGLNLFVHLENDLQVIVAEDKTVLSQILINLFTNAIKFTNQGHILFYGRLLNENESDYEFEFSVKDTGIGISPDRLPNIFERFNQAGKAIQSQYGGTGLGLSICQKLVEMHRGAIQVSSQLNQGSTFTFKMCLDKALDERVQDKLRSGIRTEKLAGISVLIAEDNAMNQQYLKSLFLKYGMFPQVAEDGLVALELLEHHQFDLILMDIRMPRLDGYETTLRLRSLHNNPNQQIPIIALTASALKDEEEKALLAGMNYHLTKPFSPEQILELMIKASEEHPPALDASRELPDFNRLHTVHELYDGDWDHFNLMVELFVKNMPGELASARLLAISGDCTLLIHQLHKIKPSYIMIGFPEMAREIEVIEKSLESGTIDQRHCQDFLVSLQKKTQDLIEKLGQPQILDS
ncbi:MAG: PAS domain S-box protein [Saprospiraceae bacterium]